MRQFSITVVTAIMIVGAGVFGGGTAMSEPAGGAEVMILGTYHFTGGGADLVNAEVDDYLAEDRQAEIAELVERLAAFAPTRIAVELLPEHEAQFNERYQAYTEGQYELTVNERQQIGMRLARRLGHDRLYAVDAQSDMDFDAMFGAAGAAGQTDLMDQVQSAIAAIQAWAAEDANPDRTVSERLASHNDAATIAELNSSYLLLAQMGGRDNPVGAEQMELWWGRNLRIFSNIADIAGPEDRVLVIYGSGHKYLLDQFVQDAPNLIWVDPMAYLAAE